MRLSLYADDAVIFLNPIQSEVRALFRIMENFGTSTGLKLSLTKCTFAPIKFSRLNLDQILDSPWSAGGFYNNLLGTT